MLGAEHFILTGSHAVALCGIDVKTNPNDLDIILVNPTGAALEVLAAFQKESPNPKFTGKGSLTYSFYFQKVKVDVWVQPTLGKEKPELSYQGISVSSLATIVAAKKKYNRAKDWIQLMQWSKSIFSASTFDVTSVSGDFSDTYPE